MSSLPRTVVCKLIRETRGAEIAEAAAVLPLMFMILLGIFWFGQAFSIYGAITRAAQEGARAGSYAPSCSTCGTDSLPLRRTNAVSAVHSALLASKLDPTLSRPPATPPTFNFCAGLTPSCDAAASSQLCVQAPVQLVPPSAAGGTQTCGISVSFQYPFQFWLPFTSLSKQKIWINSSAVVKLENQ
ncbi:MAG TPA: TadE family protein [Candidatus Acidoferrum sp.]|jgi:Flp pilus assembly protein TadG|nr:TadE family protein [Candidatus Acidoferrum sp.]